MEENDNVIGQQNREIENLRIEKTSLQNIISSIRLNDEICIRIKQIVKQEIEDMMSNSRWLLRLALASLFESERGNPGKLRALYYNTSPSFSVERLLSTSIVNQNEYSIQGYNEDSLEKVVMDIAEEMFNRIVDTIANHCINGTLDYTKPASYPISQVRDIQYDRGKIFDTQDLTQINFVYDNFTFEVNSGPKVSNESDNETDVISGEDEL